MRFDSPLNKVRVASPCPADWDQMLGNGRSRFCGQCNLNVYNLSSMTRAEAEDFIAKSEGRVCIRYYRRKDGSIITQNCPVGLRALKKRVSFIVTAIVSAMLTFLTSVGLYFGLEKLSTVERKHVMGQIIADDVPSPPLMVQIGAPVLMGQATVGRLVPVTRGELVPVTRNETKRPWYRKQLKHVR